MAQIIVTGCTRCPAKVTAGVTAAEEDASSQNPGTRMMSMRRVQTRGIPHVGQARMPTQMPKYNSVPASHTLTTSELVRSLNRSRTITASRKSTDRAISSDQ
jgi:hypothetical protein